MIRGWISKNYNNSKRVSYIYVCHLINIQLLENTTYIYCERNDYDLSVNIIFNCLSFACPLWGIIQGYAVASRRNIAKSPFFFSTCIRTIRYRLCVIVFASDSDEKIKRTKRRCFGIFPFNQCTTLKRETHTQGIGNDRRTFAVQFSIL